VKQLSEEIRLKYFYRRLIQSGAAAISLKSAIGLIGPDCAYHLYGALRGEKRKRMYGSAQQKKRRGRHGSMP
jgi:hypothetical protein